MPLTLCFDERSILAPALLHNATILMGQHYARNFSCQDSIYKLQKLLALKNACIMLTQLW